MKVKESGQSNRYKAKTVFKCSKIYFGRLGSTFAAAACIKMMKSAFCSLRFSVLVNYSNNKQTCSDYG